MVTGYVAYFKSVDNQFVPTIIRVVDSAHAEDYQRDKLGCAEKNGLALVGDRPIIFGAL